MWLPNLPEGLESDTLWILLIFELSVIVAQQPSPEQTYLWHPYVQGMFKGYWFLIITNLNETGSRSPCMRPRSDPPKVKNSTPDKIVAEKKNKKNREVNWMVSNSAKLDRRTKQHTQFGVSASNGPRDMARTKSWWKKRKKKKEKITKRIGW